MFVFNRALAKRILTPVAGLISIVGLTVYLNVVKETPTGESDSRNLMCWASSSGSGICFRETGNVVGSGSLLMSGALIVEGAMSGNSLVLSDVAPGGLTGTDVCISTGSNTICACGSCD